MKRSRLFLSLSLLTVLLASACAPAVTSSPAPAVDASATPVSQPTDAVPATLPPVQPEATLAPTEVVVQPVATSRGPELHATDPANVNLALVSTGRGRANSASDILGTDLVLADDETPLVLDAFFALSLSSNN